MRLAHISDLHGTDGLEAIVADIDRRDVDFVAITGDFVDNGRPDEFAAIEPILRPLDGRILAVPGNHDVEWQGSLGFVDRQPFDDFAFSHPRYPHAMLLDDGAVQVIGVDSTAEALGAEDLARGKVGYSQLVELAKLLEMGDPDFRVVLVHHHLFERDVGLELKDAALLRATCSARCDLFLMGHRHTWDEWSDVYGIRRIFAADKTTASQRYRIFDFRDGGIQWHTIEV